MAMTIKTTKPAGKPRDREGWPLNVGARCARYTETGVELTEQWVVTGFTSTKNHPVAVELEGLTTGGQGMSIPKRLRVLATPTGDKAPLKVQRYRARKKDVVLLEQLKERKAAERQTRRKVKRKQG